MARKTNETETVDKNVAFKIKEARIANGWSRQQLATCIGVTHQQIAKYENGENRISVGRFIIIAKALNKSLAYFFQVEAFSDYDKRMSLELLRNFVKIKKVSHRHTVSTLARLLVEN